MGFERAGFKTIWANDNNADACKTHENWSTAKVVCGDIAKVNAMDIPDADIMLGGFPCQGFSLSGPRMTIKQVQDACGISAAAVCKWQNGQAMPTLDNLIILSDLWNVKMDDLIVRQVS